LGRKYKLNIYFNSGTDEVPSNAVSPVADNKKASLNVKLFSFVF
jgi:hypothetical protein